MLSSGRNEEEKKRYEAISKAPATLPFGKVIFLCCVDLYHRRKGVTLVAEAWGDQYLLDIGTVGRV